GQSILSEPQRIDSRPSESTLLSLSLILKRFHAYAWMESHQTTHMRGESHQNTHMRGSVSNRLWVQSRFPNFKSDENRL
ncbi:hypothetical protein PIB30_109835, partial [Stylosanthes scabra]|nr:hypothetical protein [Stylosanthes scabra]